MTAWANQPNPAGAGKCKGPSGRKMCEKKSWETAKLSRGGAERVKKRWRGGMEKTRVCFPSILAAAELSSIGTQSLPPPGPVARG